MLIPNPGESQAGKSRVLAQPGLHRETLSKQILFVPVSRHAGCLLIKFSDFLLTQVYNFSKLLQLIKPIFHLQNTSSVCYRLGMKIRFFENK